MTLATAADLVRMAPVRSLVPSPPSFSGTLDELWSCCIEPNLPTPDAVADLHRQLVAYVREPGALLLVRQVRGMERRAEYTTADGTRLRATDNAPAWWVHYALSQGCQIAPGAFAHVVETLPAHLFDVARTMPTSASAAGWHIAHLFPVKDGRTDFRAWRRPEAVGRFVRNIHPCNYGLVPKPGWQRWGGDARVIALFAERFARRYAEIWDEFLLLARADPGALGRVVGPVRYSYAPNADAPPAGMPDGSPRARAVGGPVRASYPATRLLFKRDVIEPLADGDAFQVITPHGTFVMTKAEFCRVFPNVRQSVSYRERGVYHYATVPKAALQFRAKQPSRDEEM